MSCIPKLLKLKGEQSYFKINDLVYLESGGNYRGFDFCVTFTRHGHRCGYVAINPAKLTRDISYDNFGDLEVHGGITFAETPDHIFDEDLLGESKCGDIWLGFDAAHAGDKPDEKLAMKLFLNPEMQNYYEMKRRIMEIMAFTKSFTLSDSEIRTNEYMTQECKNLIDQLIANPDYRDCMMHHSS